MGCSRSKPSKAGGGQVPTLAAREAAAAKLAAIEAAKTKRANLDPNDFIIKGRSSETIFREAGSIDDQQFNIENCKDCDIFLLDQIDSSFVDYCDRCRIFIGPTRSSVFIRNCNECSFVIATRQLRTRDCDNCRFGLFCATQPVIETSVRMQFACFDFA